MALKLNRPVLALLAFSTLSGCGINAIRLDRASSMVSAGRLVESSTGTLIEQTRVANRDLLIDLVAIDPNCRLPLPMIMEVLPPSGSHYCRPSGSRPGTNDWQVERVTQRDVSATLTVVRALSGYLDLVNAVVAREPIDLGSEFANALDDLQTINGAAVEVAGLKSGLPMLSSDQTSAIKGAIDLLSVVLDEKYRVDDLRRIETVENRQFFDTTTRALALANATWLDNYRRELSRRQTFLQDRLDRMPKAGIDARRPVAAALLATIESRENLPKMKLALENTLDELVRSHNSYLILLFDDRAELSGKERKKLAKLNHDRVMGALKSLTAVLRAF